MVLQAESYLRELSRREECAQEDINKAGDVLLELYRQRVQDHSIQETIAICQAYILRQGFWSLYFFPQECKGIALYSDLILKRPQFEGRGKLFTLEMLDDVFEKHAKKKGVNYVTLRSILRSGGFENL